MSNYFGFSPKTIPNEYYYISYSRRCSDFVGAIALALYNLNMPLWYDCGAVSDDERNTAIVKAIRDCKAVILFLSPDLFEKEDEYVFTEYDLATEYKKAIYSVWLINPDTIKGAALSSYKLTSFFMSLIDSTENFSYYEVSKQELTNYNNCDHYFHANVISVCIADKLLSKTELSGIEKEKWEHKMASIFDKEDQNEPSETNIAFFRFPVLSTLSAVLCFIINHLLESSNIELFIIPGKVIFGLLFSIVLINAIELVAWFSLLCKRVLYPLFLTILAIGQLPD